MSVLPNGLGESSGDVLAVSSPTFTSGSVWYVDDSGTDAASPAGKSRLAPLATLSQAITNAADGDIICCLDGHAETLTSTLTINKNVTITAGGTTTVNSVQRPTVTFTNNQAAAALFNITGSATAEFNVELRNLYFPTNAQACSVARITMTPANTPGSFRMEGCYFDCGGNDDAAAIIANADALLMRNNRFLSVSTTIATRPTIAISLAAAPTVVTMDGDVFDGGTVGFDDNYAVDMSTNAPINLYGLGVGLLRGADMKVSSTLGYYVNAPNATGAVRVDE